MGGGVIPFASNNQRMPEFQGVSIDHPEALTVAARTRARLAEGMEKVGEGISQLGTGTERAGLAYKQWEDRKKEAQDRIDEANAKAAITIATNDFTESLKENTDYKQYGPMVDKFRQDTASMVDDLQASPEVKQRLQSYLSLHQALAAQHARSAANVLWINEQKANGTTLLNDLAKQAAAGAGLDPERIKFKDDSGYDTQAQHLLNGLGDKYIGPDGRERDAAGLFTGEEKVKLGEAWKKSVQQQSVERNIQDNPRETARLLEDRTNWPALDEHDRNTKIRQAKTEAIRQGTEAEKDVYASLAQVQLDGRVPTKDDVPREKWNALLKTDPEKANNILSTLRVVQEREDDRADRIIARQERKEERAERKADREERQAEKDQLKWQKVQQGMNYRNLAANKDQLVKVNLDEMLLKEELTDPQYKYLVNQKNLIAQGKDDPVRYAETQKVIQRLEKDLQRGVFGPKGDVKSNEKLLDVTEALRAWSVDPENKNKKPSDFYDQIMQPYKNAYVGWLLDSFDKRDPAKRVEEMKARGAKTPTPPASSGGTDYGYGKRQDGTNKGRGFLGEIPTKDGKVMTEMSIGVNINGKETEIPLLVPTLTKGEIKNLQNGWEPTKEMVKKAVDHAKQRIAAGKSPYADDSESPGAKKAAPTVDEWLTAARKANPKATDDELRAYYKNKYGGK